jgi:hypothetical protein
MKEELVKAVPVKGEPVKVEAGDRSHDEWVSIVFRDLTGRFECTGEILRVGECWGVLE